jgi:hypothetical protein
MCYYSLPDEDMLYKKKKWREEEDPLAKESDIIILLMESVIRLGIYRPLQSDLRMLNEELRRYKNERREQEANQKRLLDEHSGSSVNQIT